MANHGTSHDDVELSDLEGDAFIPGPRIGRENGKSTRFITRWSLAIRSSIEGLSKIKIVALICLIFFLLIGLSSIIKRPGAVHVPAESLLRSKKLAESLSSTAVPDYVLTYAPLILLDKNEMFYPSDLHAHVSNTYAASNFTIISDAPNPLTLNNLNELNLVQAKEVFLTSTASLLTLPSYLHGEAPDSRTLATENAISCVIIIVEKQNGIVDAFYMYFYTFNQGPTVLGYELGDHLGDWEHNMVRFEHGIPKAIWYSQHEYGEAFSYNAVQKAGKRPISYSAKGSHANYAIAGSIDLHKNNALIPAHIAYDYTSKGALWDPTLSAYYYTYSIATSQFDPVIKETPVNYLYFNGWWGDKEIPADAKGQEDFHGYHKWTGGPQGPVWKYLDRPDVCWPRKEGCDILDTL